MDKTQHVYRAATGEYLGPLRDRYSQGSKPDGAPWPDSLIYAAQGCGGQGVGINADLAELRDGPPARRKPRVTIWNALAEKLGREPTHREACDDVKRILREGEVEMAGRGALRHQRKRG